MSRRSVPHTTHPFWSTVLKTRRRHVSTACSILAARVPARVLFAALLVPRPPETLRRAANRLRVRSVIRLMTKLRACLAVLICCAATPRADDRVRIVFDSSEADRVLAILDKRASAVLVNDADWRALFLTDTY